MRNKHLLLTLASAVLFPLALPNEFFPLGFPILGVIALIPFYVAIVRTESAGAATRLGMLFGAVSTLLANYWLLFFGEYTFWTITGPVVGYLGYNAILAGYLWYATRAPRAYRPFLFAAVWTLYEYLKSTGFLAYPWGLSAYPYNSVPVLIQVADITGVWGLCLVVMVTTCALGELLLSLPWRRSTLCLLAGAGRQLAVAVLLVGIVVGYGVVKLQRDIPQKATVDVLLVQQDADAWNTSDIDRPLLVAQQQTVLGLDSGESPPDLIAWSETSLRWFYVESRSWYERNPVEQPFVQFVESLPAPLITGAPVQDPDDAYAIHNAVLVIDPDTEVREWYAKRHLVPFVENVPFWDTPWMRSFFRNVIGITGIWSPGEGDPVLQIALQSGEPLRLVTPICFEDGFADLVRYYVLDGADFILNLTNNGWSRTDSAQLQHFVAARFRAVETRLGLVRSTNSGYTCVVDAWGTVTASLPMFEPGYLRATVPVYDSPLTVYMQLGDYLPQALAVILIVLFVVCEVLKRTATAKRPRRPLSDWATCP